MLTRQHLSEFAENGFLVLPGVVPEELLDAADKELDGFLQREPPPDGFSGRIDYVRPPPIFQPPMLR